MHKGTTQRSGNVELLYTDEWNEVVKTGRGKDRGVVLDHLIPEHGVFSIRFPKTESNKRIRIFVEDIEEPSEVVNT